MEQRDAQQREIENVKLRMLAMRRIDEATGCWIWIGSNYPGARFGQIKVNKIRVPVPRLALALFKNVILTPQQKIQRTCLNPSCFNPDHLEARDRNWRLRARAEIPLHSELRQRTDEIARRTDEIARLIHERDELAYQLRLQREAHDGSSTGYGDRGIVGAEG